MAYTLSLPADKKERQAALNRIIDEGIELRHIREVEWWLIHYYMQGAREFGLLDYARGVVDIGYYNRQGSLQFRYDLIVSAFQTQVGRLMQMDLRPTVNKRHIGLEDMQKASTAQVILDYLFSSSYIEQIKAQLIPSLLKYGLMGLTVWQDDQTIGIDVVPAWEIVPIPSNPIEPYNIRGYARVRYVPISWVKGLRIAKDIPSDVWNQMQGQDAPIGAIHSAAQETFTTFTQQAYVGGSADTPYGTRSNRKLGLTRDNQPRGDMEKIVPFAEVWMDTGDGHLHSYTVLCGRVEIFHQTYEGFQFRIPFAVCRDIPAGGFWGRSFCSTLLPLNVEVENALLNLLQNIQNLDTFGILVEPTTLGIPPTVQRGSDGIRRLRYEPDYSSPYDLRPFVIQPYNSGTAPITALKTAHDMMQLLANQPYELMQGQAPGRVDSSAGLGLLYEMSNMPISPCATSIANAFVQCYEAALDVARAVWTSHQLVSITYLDDQLMGITIDPATGQMELDPARIPLHTEVEIGVRSMMPRSVEKEKQELQQALQLGAIDMLEYRIEVRKRGLSLPVGGEAEWQNYRRATLENIMLFGDGRTPGQVIVSDRDMHNVHLRVLLNVMSRPEFYMASPEVRDAFVRHYEAHLLSSSATLPDQLPYPEQAAEQAQWEGRFQVSGMGGAGVGGGKAPGGGGGGGGGGGSPESLAALSAALT